MRWKDVCCEKPDEKIYYLVKCDDFKIDGEIITQKIRFYFCTYSVDKSAWIDVYSQSLLSTLEYNKYISLESLNEFLSSN